MSPTERDPNAERGAEPPVRLLTQGSATANVLILALPAMTTMLLQSAFNLVDIFWVGRLGSHAIAAVSVSSFLIWALFSLTEALSVGVNTLVARRLGASDPSGADRAAWQGIVWGVLAGGASAVLGLPLLPAVFGWMGTAEQVTEQGLGYAGLLYGAAPLVFLFFVVDAIFRGRGDAVTPVKILSLALVMNLVLDPVLILGLGPFPAMGVKGAALSTILSRGAGVTLALYLLRRPLRRGLQAAARPMGREVWRMIRIGAPISATGFLFCGVYVVLARITARFGTEPLAALGIGHKVESLSYLAGVGFGSAAATLVGQNLGAGNPDRADKLVKRCLGLLSIFQGAYTLVLLFGAPYILTIFTDDPGVAAHGATYLRIVALSQVFMGIELVYAAAFGGAGSTFPSISITLPLTLLRIPLAWILGVRWGWGAMGIWWAISLSTIASGLVLAAWWRRGTWRAYQPDRDEPPRI